MEEIENWVFGLFLKCSFELPLLSSQRWFPGSPFMCTLPPLSLCEFGQSIPLPALWFPRVLVPEALLLSNRLTASAFLRATKGPSERPALTPDGRRLAFSAGSLTSGCPHLPREGCRPAFLCWITDRLHHSVCL